MSIRRLLALAAPATASEREPVSAHTWPLRGLLLGAAAIYAVYALRNSFEHEGKRIFTLFDDAMISMRYARNLAEGRGLVWNPGEQPVEGYTNFLWTLWMAVLHWCSARPALGVIASAV